MPFNNKNMGTMSLKKLSGREIEALSTSTVELRLGTWTVTTDANDSLVFLFRNSETSIGMKLDPPEGEGALYHLLSGDAPQSFKSQLTTSCHTSGRTDGASFSDYQEQSSLTKASVADLQVKYAYDVIGNHEQLGNPYGQFNLDKQYQGIDTAAAWRGVTSDKEHFFVQADHENFLMGTSVIQKYRKADGKCMWSKDAMDYFSMSDILTTKGAYRTDYGEWGPKYPQIDDPSNPGTLIDDPAPVVDSWRNLFGMAFGGSEGCWFRNAPVFATDSEEEDRSAYLFQTNMSSNGLWLIKFDRTTGDRVWAVQAFAEELAGSSHEMGSLAPAIKKHNGKNYIFLGTGSLQNAINRTLGDELVAKFGDRGSLACVVDNDPADMSAENGSGELLWRTHTCPPLFKTTPVAEAVLRHPNFDATAIDASATYDERYDPFRPSTTSLDVITTKDTYGPADQALWGYEASGTPSAAPVGSFTASFILRAGTDLPAVFVGQSINAGVLLMDVAGAAIVDNAGVPEYHVNGALFQVQIAGQSEIPAVANQDEMTRSGSSWTMNAGKQLLMEYPSTDIGNGFKFGHQLNTYIPGPASGAKFGLAGMSANYIAAPQVTEAGAGANDKFLYYDGAVESFSKTFAVHAVTDESTLLASAPLRIADMYYPKRVGPGYVVQTEFEAQNLNYYGNNIWGGTPAMDFANNRVYAGTGQTHKIPEDETNALNLSSTAFLETRLDVIAKQQAVNDAAAAAAAGDASGAQALADAEAALVVASEAAQAAVEQAIAEGLDKKSPRGLLSHVDSAVAFRIFEEDGHAAGSVAWVGNTLNWDYWGALGKPSGESVFTSSSSNPGTNATAAGNLVGNDGDFGAGVTLFKSVLVEGQVRDVVAGVTKSGIAIAFDAMTGAQLQFDITGPASALGGANYNCCSDGKEVVYTVNANIAYFAGAINPQFFGSFEEKRWRGQTLHMMTSYINAWNVRTGETLWNAAIGRPDAPDTTFGGLSFYNGMVICNSQGKMANGQYAGEPTVQVFDALTGEQLHQSEDLLALSGGGDSAKGGGSASQIVVDGGMLFRHIGRDHMGISGSASSHGLVFAAPLAAADSPVVNAELLINANGFYKLNMEIDLDQSELKLMFDDSADHLQPVVVPFGSYDPISRAFTGGSIGTDVDIGGPPMTMHPSGMLTNKMSVGQCFLLEGRGMAQVCLLDVTVTGLDGTTVEELGDWYLSPPAAAAV